jgi:hypothetical protein
MPFGAPFKLTQNKQSLGGFPGVIFHGLKAEIPYLVSLKNQ